MKTFVYLASVLLVMNFGTAFGEKHKGHHGGHHGTQKKEEHHSISEKDVKGPENWAGVSAMRFHHHYFTGAMNEAAFDAAKKAGVTVVVDLRTPGEIKQNDAEIAKARGMSYTNIPVDTSKPFDKTAFNAVQKIFEDSHGKTTLLYCASGNRAGAWFATHLHGDHQIPLDDAIKIGRKVGMTRPEMEKSVRAYFAK